MKLKKSISKDEINELPIGKFEGHTLVVSKPDEVSTALEILAQEPILGFDTESRPSFKKGKAWPVSLIQLASADIACLFQIGIMGLHPELISFLARPQVKAGVAVGDDAKAIAKIAPCEITKLIDLATIAKSNNIQNISLRALTAITHGIRISKGAKLSNWANHQLSEAQISYAATDAWAGYIVYKSFEAAGFLDT